MSVVFGAAAVLAGIILSGGEPGTWTFVLLIAALVVSLLTTRLR